MSEILQISVAKFKIQNIILNLRKPFLNAKILNPKHYFLTRGICYKFQLQIQNYRRYLNVSRNIII